MIGEEKNRPLSVEDLFKDDPPLDLPKIKGLDDYVPPEEFIDDNLTERVEEAGKATPKKENKAARSLPQKPTVKPLKYRDRNRSNVQTKQLKKKVNN